MLRIAPLTCFEGGFLLVGAEWGNVARACGGRMTFSSAKPAMFAYPALFDSADALSSRAQRLYLLLIRAEYALLILSALLAWALSLTNFDGGNVDPPPQSAWLYSAYVFVFLGTLGILLTRNLKKPEQDWYRARALAESIKTSSWRYAMRADPFEDTDKLLKRRGEFRDHLYTILAGNRAIGERLPPDVGAGDQITSSMEEVRALSLPERKAFYLEHRICEQRNWYTSRARANKGASERWFALGVATYLLILLLILIGFSDLREPGVLGVLVVIASSMLGWVQIRKFNELVSSYTLTSHEIGIIQHKSQEVECEEGFSSFVNESELAFSREHTQWVARSVSV